MPRKKRKMDTMQFRVHEDVGALIKLLSDLYGVSYADVIKNTFTDQYGNIDAATKQAQEQVDTLREQRERLSKKMRGE